MGVVDVKGHSVRSGLCVCDVFALIVVHMHCNRYPSHEGADLSSWLWY